MRLYKFIYQSVLLGTQRQHSTIEPDSHHMQTKIIFKKIGLDFSVSKKKSETHMISIMMCTHLASKSAEIKKK